MFELPGGIDRGCGYVFDGPGLARFSGAVGVVHSRAAGIAVGLGPA